MDRRRFVDPFFQKAIDSVFLDTEPQIYIMDGPIGVGKTSNFLVPAAYQVSQCVVPVKQGQYMVRESSWVAVRENENSIVATLSSVFENAIFSPELMAHPESPIKITGNHPTYIVIRHKMGDGTFLKMTIECHGFNNPQALGRIQSREFLGGIIPECQTVPWVIVETVRERSGRWRVEDLRIEKEIGGKRCVLSGTEQLKIVLADCNIPPRPHAMYDVIYDQRERSAGTYRTITPPSPLIPLDASKAPKATLEKYPVTRFRKKRVVWVPNKKVYFMTRHYESKALDDAGRVQIDPETGKPRTIPWSGYAYWMHELHRPDSHVNRLILGRPDSMGGTSAVYHNFDSDRCVLEKRLNHLGDVWIGYDPGKYAAFVFYQIIDDAPHIFHEIVFHANDGLLSRQQINEFVAPYIHKELKENTTAVICDPAGHHGTAHGESPVACLRQAGIRVKPCVLSNQQTQERIDMLGYFIDAGTLTVDPSCKSVITALLGGYRYKTLRSGVVGDSIDKDESSHTCEAAQYAAANIYRMLVSRKRRKNGKVKQIGRIAPRP